MPTTNYPTSLDDGTSLPNPGSSDLLANATTNLQHANQHDIGNDAIKAVEAKNGITNSQVATSDDARIRVREYADFTVVPGTFTAGFTDDEFMATSLNTGLWTWLNQATTTPTQLKSHLLLDRPETNVNALSGIYQPIPGGTTWTVEAKAALHDNGSGAVGAGLMLYESGTGKVATFLKFFSVTNSNTATAMELVLQKWTNSTTFSANDYTFSSQTWRFNVEHPQPLYLKVSATSTQYLWYFSNDGIGWVLVSTDNKTGLFTAAANNIGLCVAEVNSGGSSSGDMLGSFDYIRQTA